MEEKDIKELVDQVRSDDPAIRMKAAIGAGPAGAGAVAPLGALLDSEDKGIVRAADEALRRITNYATRPGAKKEAQAISEELIKLAQPGHSVKVRRKALYLLGYVGDDRAVGPVSKLLTDDAMREDARMTLEAIPGRASQRALESAGKTVPADFKPNLALSLRRRRNSFKTVGTSKSI